MQAADSSRVPLIEAASSDLAKPDGTSNATLRPEGPPTQIMSEHQEGHASLRGGGMFGGPNVWVGTLNRLRLLSSEINIRALRDSY